MTKNNSEQQMKISIPSQCLRCGHRWNARGVALSCPKCKSYKYRLPLQRFFRSKVKHEETIVPENNKPEPSQDQTEYSEVQIV